jgi:mannitol-specific phosphotransferase system IIBC component
VPKSILPSEITTIIFVCEAGIGSSLMSVNALKKKLKAANVDHIKVVHSATARVPASAQFILCHNGIKKSVQAKAPNAVVVGFNLFFNDPIFDKVVKAIVANTEISDN